jgi:phage terminase small subunit
MPALRYSRREQFAQAVASGKNLLQAYQSAGYNAAGKGWRSNPYRLRHARDIAARIEELLEKRMSIEEQATERAVRHLALTKEAVGREFALVGFANMMDFTALDAEGRRVLDLTNMTREQMAAVHEMSVDYYVDGKGENALRVKKVKVKLHPKITALTSLARLFGWIVDGRSPDDDVRRIEERLRMMTPEQQLEDAKALHQRARRALALADQRAKVIEGEGTEK